MTTDNTVLTVEVILQQVGYFQYLNVLIIENVRLEADTRTKLGNGSVIAELQHERAERSEHVPSYAC